MEQGDLFAEAGTAVARPKTADGRPAAAPPPSKPWRVRQPCCFPSQPPPCGGQPRASGARGCTGVAAAPAPRPPLGVQRVDVEPSRARPLEPTVFTVSELTELVKGTLEASFRRVLVRGEVSGFRGPNATGHLYFALKDAGATLDVKIWASTARSVRFRLEEGLEVLVEGYLDVYAKAGRYSLIVQRIEPAGAGALALAFAQLKERLTAEGLMGERRVRPPSRAAAAAPPHRHRHQPHRRRASGLPADCPSAPPARLHPVVPRPRAGRWGGRGGGAGPFTPCAHGRRRGGGGSRRWLGRGLVDLQRGGGGARHCRLPGPGGVGGGARDGRHHRGLRRRRPGPTPSAAAELVVPVLAELEAEMAQGRLRLRRVLQAQLAERRHALAELRRQLDSPRHAVADLRQGLVTLEDRLEASTRRGVRSHGEAIRRLRERLDRFRPEALLAQRRQVVHALRSRLLQAMQRRLVHEREALVRLRRALERRSPAAPIAEGQRQLAALRAQLHAAGLGRVVAARQRLSGAAGKLDALSPLKVMARGYAVAYRRDTGALVAAAGEVAVGVALKLRWAPPGSRSLDECGEVDATVTQVRLPKTQD